VIPASNAPVKYFVLPYPKSRLGVSTWPRRGSPSCAKGEKLRIRPNVVLPPPRIVVLRPSVRLAPTDADCPIVIGTSTCGYCRADEKIDAPSDHLLRSAEYDNPPVNWL
jgi:hypothetical protein